MNNIGCGLSSALCEWMKWARGKGRKAQIASERQNETNASEMERKSQWRNLFFYPFEWNERKPQVWFIVESTNIDCGVHAINRIIQKYIVKLWIIICSLHSVVFTCLPLALFPHFSANCILSSIQLNRISNHTIFEWSHVFWAQNIITNGKSVNRKSAQIKTNVIEWKTIVKWQVFEWNKDNKRIECDTMIRIK